MQNAYAVVEINIFIMLVMEHSDFSANVREKYTILVS